MSPATCWGGLFVVGALLSQVPSARGTGNNPGPPAEPPRLTFLSLQRPLPPLARFKAGVHLMGSTDDEVLLAYTECVSEPLKQLCDPAQFADETPVRRVRLDRFELQRLEVSVADYDRCVRARRCRAPGYYPGGERFRRDDYPVTLVSWEGARDYCAFVGLRLPTEAEFERAARGTRGRKYAWGELYNSRLANHGVLASQAGAAEDGYLELAPVRSFEDGQTPEGVLNLAGNVAEWVFDHYAPNYSTTDLTNPRGPSTDHAGSRVLRGGHYESPRADLRGATRFDAAPDDRRPTHGFRCAR